MTATNHALTGAIIGFAIGNPLLAVPLAFASHFALDAIPHFGIDPTSDIRQPWFTQLLVADAGVCLVFAAMLAGLAPTHWLTAVVCAFAAASPDLMWAKRFWRVKHGQKIGPLKNPIMRFHGWIQWFQRPPGALVEAAWFIAAIIVLGRLIH